VVKNGAATFAAATGLSVMTVRGIDQVKLDDENHPPIVNFNSDMPPAYGVRVVRHVKVGREGVTGFTPAVGAREDGEGSSVPNGPYETQAVRIIPQTCNENMADYAGFWTTPEMDAKKPDGTYKHPGSREWYLANPDFKPEEVGAGIKQNHDEILVNYLEFTVAHELGHACGAHHHDPLHSGDASCLMYYWNDAREVYTFATRKWNPGKNAITFSGPFASPYGNSHAFVPWHFCESSFPNLKPR